MITLRNTCCVCFLLLACISVHSDGWIIGEHLTDQILETPHPYPGSHSGNPELVWSDYYEYPEASYIVFKFARFDLAPGDWVEIKDPGEQKVYTFTGKGLYDQETDFVVNMIPGSEAIVNLYSVNSKVNHYGYRIERVTRGYNDKELIAMYGEETYKTICGTDQKMNAKCYESSPPNVYNRSRAVARVITNGGGSCTGWIISCENHLITNNHCSTDDNFNSQAEVNATEWQFMFERPTCEGGAATWELSFMGGTYIESHYNLDYTLIRAPVTQNPQAVYGYLQIENRVPSVDEQIYIPQHAGGYPKQLAVLSTHSQDQSGNCEIYSTTRQPCRGGVTELGYYCDTEGGSSGSPILSRNTHAVVGLHHCGSCPNLGVKIQQIWQNNQSGSNPLPACSLYGSSPTSTPTRTATPTSQTSTPTRTATPPTGTAVPTLTPTRTPTSGSATPTRTATPPTGTVLPTNTPTRTATPPTGTSVPTNTPTRTPTRTPTGTPPFTNTQLPATETPTPTPQERTNTPTPFASPSPTLTPTSVTTSSPTPTSKGHVSIFMSSDRFRPGDHFQCVVSYTMTETHSGVPLFVLLDIWGNYFFAPSFSLNLDYYPVNPIPLPQSIPVLDFIWPTGAGTGSNVFWLAALLDPDLRELWSNLATAEFGWEE